VNASVAAARWAAVWADAWPAADVDAVAALYADDALFVSEPFRERQAPREYAAWAFADQRSAECRFGAPLVSGDRAVVDWWAVVVDRQGSAETLAGASFLRFDGSGGVVEQRDVWSSAPGRREVEWAAT
jgi:hypothetical protein